MHSSPNLRVPAAMALLALLLAADAHGQRAPLTLADAFARARTSGVGQRVADARRDMSLGRVRELSQLPNPTLEWRRENLGSPLQPDIFATLYLPVDVTGRRLALRGARGEGQIRASADAVAERREAELQVARAWLRAALADGAVTVARAQAEALHEVATVDSTRAAEGVVSEGVALRTRLEADRSRATVASLDGDRARARAELARVLGVTDDSLPALATLDAPALPAGPDSAVARRVAVETRPELAAREAGVREAEARLSAERRGLIGDMQLQGGTKETGGFMTGQVGVAMPFPIFNRNDGARQRARGEANEARALRDAARIGVSADAVAALHAYEATRALAVQARTFATRGQDVATIARASYREGQATLVELLDAERAAADAKTAHLRWAADAWLSRLELERALGARLDADGPLELPLLSSIRTTP